jgi:hypothetical protein
LLYVTDNVLNRGHVTLVNTRRNFSTLTAGASTSRAPIITTLSALSTVSPSPTASLGNGALGVRQKSKFTCGLDRITNVALMLLAVSRHFTTAYLPAF